ncbi:class I SAM-dependent methyltransferase [Nocardioides aestuarii]|uniref:Class I SAM-dependent methyltransferase n=1 Tax=Nocardioides aestuarii TaxID=252231 RepID=A0ABW4TPZ0_9ACTN
MGAWTEHVVPRMADRALRSHEIGELRRQACAPLRGDLVEIGFGSGLNVRWYPPSVSTVAAVEPSDVGWGLSAARRERTDVPVRRRGLDGQRLDEREASYDAALVTFSLCTIPDPVLALTELRRVLRTGGILCVLEHGLSPDPPVARWQHRLDPVQRRAAGGCHLSRDVTALVEGAGFAVDHLETFYLDGPALARPWGYTYLLHAHVPSDG